MRKSILLRARRVEYELERKRVKGINLRVRADGSLYVSAPHRVPEAFIEQLLLERQDQLLEAVERALRARQAEEESLRDGGAVSVWGKPVTLRVAAGRRNAVTWDGERLLLTVKDPADEALKRRTLEAWRKASCAETLTALCRQYYPAFARRGVAFPTLSFRRMRSRWGSCRTQKGALSFNTRLSELPPDCAAYVVVHEFAHFLQPNHSPAFYAEVERVLPDWRARRASIRAWEKAHPM